jgi:transcriptional regulator with XRE-family HTH domain
MRRFGEKLRTLRERHSMSQRDLAKALGFAQGHIHFLETGKRKPSAEFVYKLAQLFHITTDQLLNDDEEV